MEKKIEYGFVHIIDDIKLAARWLIAAPKKRRNGDRSKAP